MLSPWLSALRHHGRVGVLGFHHMRNVIQLNLFPEEKQVVFCLFFCSCRQCTLALRWWDGYSLWKCSNVIPVLSAVPDDIYHLKCAPASLRHQGFICLHTFVQLDSQRMPTPGWLLKEVFTSRPADLERHDGESCQNYAATEKQSIFCGQLFK